VPSIIVPARNGSDFTASCLGALLHALARLNLSCEFILIDDASDPSEKLIDVFLKHRSQAKGHQTKIIRARKHQHYTGVFSAGLQLATRDLIFFISNDMFVTPSFLEALLLVSSLSRDFGIVRGTSNYVDSHPEHALAPPEFLKSYPDIDKFSREVFNNNGARYEEDKLLSGDAILLKRSLIERIGVLDLRFFGYFGDVDFGMRAQLAGFKLVCAKGAWLFHQGAGHIKREFEKQQNVKFEDLHAKRMALVEVAYQEFRAKWNIASPATSAEMYSIDFMAKARANAERVPLKYDFPQSVMDDCEFF